MREQTRKRLALLFLIAGLVLLAASIREVGLSNIFSALQRLHYRILLILAFPLSWNLLQALAWQRVLAVSGSPVPYRLIFLVRLAGVAVSSLLPMGVLAADPYRVYALRRRLTKSESVSSMVIDRSFQTVSNALFLILTVAAAFYSLPIPQERKAALMALPTVMAAGVLLLLLWQKKGLIHSLIAFARKLGARGNWLEGISAKSRRLDELVSAFYRRKSHFAEMLFYHMVSRLMGMVEIHFIAAMLGIPLSFTHALFLSSLDAVINIVFVFVPGSVGVMEGGFGVLAYLLGMDPAHGVLVQLIRRIRQIFWIFLGLAAARVISRKD